MFFGFCLSSSCVPYIASSSVIARSVLSNVYLVLSAYTTIILRRGFFGGGKCARSVIMLCYSSMQYEMNVYNITLNYYHNDI